MVTRKPVPQAQEGGLALPTSPPYPVTPVTTDVLSQYQAQDLKTANHLSEESTSETANAWREEGQHVQHQTALAVPPSLRAGPPGSSQPISQEMRRPNATTTNPYLQKQSRSEVTDHKDSSAAAWGGFAERPAQHSEANPPPPIRKGKILFSKNYQTARF